MSRKNKKLSKPQLAILEECRRNGNMLIAQNVGGRGFRWHWLKPCAVKPKTSSVLSLIGYTNESINWIESRLFPALGFNGIIYANTFVDAIDLQRFFNKTKNSYATLKMRLIEIDHDVELKQPNEFENFS